MFAGGGASGDEKQQFQHNQQQNSIETKNLRMQQIQLSVLKATRLLFRHQTLLRKILRQRSPGFVRYTSEDSLTSDKNGDPDKPTEEAGKATAAATDSEAKKFDETSRDNELLVQSILLRATQPSPLRACYTFQEMELAALNLSQSLANHVHAETSAPLSRPALPPSQPTLIHGIPIYNNTNQAAAVLDDCTPSSGSKRLPPCPLVAQIVEMGFTRRGVEAAIKSLSESCRSISCAISFRSFIKNLEIESHTAFILKSHLSHSNSDFGFPFSFSH
jgi:E3 ubiquitin-protein ligase HERC2